MLKKFAKTILAITALSFSMTMQPSLAAMTVFDPWAAVQTTKTAIEAVTAQVTRLNQLKETIKNNIANFGGAEVAGLVAEYKKVKDVYDSAKKLQTSVLGIKNNFDDVKSMFGASNYKTFAGFAADMERRAKTGDAVAKNLFENSKNALATVKASYESHEKIVDKASGVSGITEAAQSTTAAVGVLIQQNNAMLSMMAADQVAKSVEVAKTTQREKNTEDFGTTYRKKIAAEAAALNAKYPK